MAAPRGDDVTSAAKLRATGLIIAAACCFGSIPILTVLGTNLGAGLMTLLVGRYALAFFLLAAYVAFTRLELPPRRDAIILIVFFGGAQAMVAYTSLEALRYIPAAMMSFLFYTFPASVAIISAVTGAERLTPVRILALGLSLSGILVMVGLPSSWGANLTGTLLALASGTIYAIYLVAIRSVSQRVHPVITTTYISLGAGVLCVGIGVMSGTLAWSPLPSVALIIFALAVLSTVFAFMAFLRGLSVLGSVRTSIVSTIEPFWTSIVGALVLSQPLTLGTLGGGILIASAVILLVLRPDKQTAG